MESGRPNPRGAPQARAGSPSAGWRRAGERLGCAASSHARGRMTKSKRGRSHPTRLRVAPQQVRPRLAVERDGPVLRVWLDRPERRNALDTATLEALTELYTGLQRDFETRVVVLGGRGPSFCAGADRERPPGASAWPRPPARASASAASPRRIGWRACRAIEACEVVTLARVHGHAVGGGVALALRLRLPDCRAGQRLPRPRGGPRNSARRGAPPRA